MKLLVGLGNPGVQYLQTRHNAGFLFVEHLADELNADVFSFHKKSQTAIVESDYRGTKLLLAKPQTFMNESGTAVRALVDYYKISLNDVCVVHDDLDLRVGEFKLQPGKGPKAHNGIISIEQHLKSTEFLRLRLGVDGRAVSGREKSGDEESMGSISTQPFLTTSKMSGRDYVLQSFQTTELTTLQEDVFPQATVELLAHFGDK